MQNILAQLKSVLKSSANSFRGFSLSCPMYGQEKSCGSNDCTTCRLYHLVQSFTALVNWSGPVEGFARK